MERAMRLWNAGASAETFEQEGLQGIYQQLEAKYGCQSIPVSDLLGCRRRKPTKEELEVNVGSPVLNDGKVVYQCMTYGDWKGITGPAVQLRAAVKTGG